MLTFLLGDNHLMIQDRSFVRRGMLPRMDQHDEELLLRRERESGDEDGKCDTELPVRRPLPRASGQAGKHFDHHRRQRGDVYGDALHAMGNREV